MLPGILLIFRQKQEAFELKTISYLVTITGHEAVSVTP
jgi:hypothetical protein